MSGPFSDVTRSIFDDKNVLSEQYQPPSIAKRDEEIEQYRHALKDILFGSDPKNIMVFGKTGVGKTAVTVYMLESLREQAKTRPEAPPVYVHKTNCNQKSLYLILRSFINRLLPPEENEFPKRGVSVADAFDKLYDQLNRTGGTHLFLLDEIDHLEQVDTLLYNLPRASSNNHISEAQIGIIGISNNYTFRNDLSAKVKDTLMEAEISFSPYNSEELKEILRDRAEEAFVDGGCDQSAIQKAAAISARDSENARQAIDLLRVGGEIAEQENDSIVRDDHVDEARPDVHRGRLADRIRDQTKHAQYLLETIAYLERKGVTPTKSKAIKQDYDKIAENWGQQPLDSIRSIQKYLDELNTFGFTQRFERNKGRRGGQYFEYDLDMDADLVIKTRKEIEAENRIS